jgi:hypothetical protein
MSDQQFNERVGYVAGRDVNVTENHAPTHLEKSLSSQKWVTKHYPIGKSFTAGEITFVFAVLLLFTMLSMLWSLPPAFSSIPFFLQLVFFPILLIAAQVSAYGVAVMPNTCSGIVRDTHGHIFIGKLGGDGILCPKCRAQLRFFFRLGSSPILKCTRNINHSWAFDFTAVEDEVT